MCYVTMVRGLFSGAVILSFAVLSYVKGDCWDTGCQPYTWRERGCWVYGMNEVGQQTCDGGTIFSCCHGSAADAPTLNEASNLGKVGDLTYYELGMTACGQWYSNYDMVAALAFSHFTTANPNVDPICGRRLNIVDPVSGRSIMVKVVDKCGGCKESDVDVSPAAFQALRPLSVGRFQVNWDFV